MVADREGGGLLQAVAEGALPAAAGGGRGGRPLPRPRPRRGGPARLRGPLRGAPLAGRGLGQAAGAAGARRPPAGPAPRPAGPVRAGRRRPAGWRGAARGRRRRPRRAAGPGGRHRAPGQARPAARRRLGRGAGRGGGGGGGRGRAARRPPARLRELAERIGAAFGGLRVNPDSPAQVLRAFAAAGVPVRSTRSHELRGLDHPAAPLLLEYKELARLHAAHGWSWQDAWVRDGRFRPEYVPGGVVSGRWASRGGGALQIPRAVRRAVVADPGWALVVADASQLEPRVLAALSGDRRMAAAAATGDLYAALAADAFGGDRAPAKGALLAAMYGGGGGAGPGGAGGPV